MKKVFLISMLLILLTTVGLSAASFLDSAKNSRDREGTVIVGTGTRPVYELPVFSQYLYSYSQSIYLQSEIPSSDHIIDTIWYHWDGLSEPEAFSEWTVLMGHTTKTGFTNPMDWIPYAELTQVFLGQVIVPGAAGWIEIPLQQSFTYDNIRNLVVAVNETEKGSGGSGGSFTGTDHTEVRSIMIIDEGDSPLYAESAEYLYATDIVSYYPNIKLHFADVDITPVVSIEKVGANLKLDWPDVAGVTMYQVYEADTPGGAWIPIMPPTPASEYLITNPTSKKFYHVTSLESGGPTIPENFVSVQGGTFNNGTGSVTISDFYMDKYEMTQAGFQAVLGSNPSTFPGNPSFPVDNVNWFDTIVYCNTRSLSEGLNPCYSYNGSGTNPANWPAGWTNDNNISCDWAANGYRLPTEMEWMYAAKGGNQTPATGYTTYAGSSAVAGVAWYTSNSGGSPHNVGTKLPNELGLYDMSGNIREWNWGLFGVYPTESQLNPKGDTIGDTTRRMQRGGDWNSSSTTCTVSKRLDSPIGTSANTTGFRVVRGSL